MDGYAAYGATSGEEAMEILRQVKPDLITLDLEMPEEWGPKFHQRFSGMPQFKDIPVVVISGLPGIHRAIRKAVATLSKPFKPEEPRQDAGQPLPALIHLHRPGFHFVLQADRQGVHQVGAAGLDDLVVLLRLPPDGLGQPAQGGIKEELQPFRGRQVHRRREHVVGRLAGVDVVVGVHGHPQARGGVGGDDP